jgi:alkylation response protein AidB-like acyl-CoA dehydrogenase
VLVRTRPTPGPTSLTLLIVPTDLPGFGVKERLRKLGLHTSPTGWLVFDNVRVPKQLTLGKLHMGYFHFARNIQEERLVGGAAAISVASLVLEDTIRHVRQRVAFERPLSKLQTVRHRISEMAAELEISRRFVYSVCESFRDGHVEEKEICMIKFHVFEMVQRVIERCIQLHGGSGFLEENWVSRVYRDVRVLTIGGGTSELMKDLVATYLRL